MSAYFHAEDCKIDDLAALCSQTLQRDSVPIATDICQNVPIYAVQALDLEDPALLAEWAAVLHTGPGIIVLQGAFADTAPIDRASKIYRDIIAAEKAAGTANADHFAAGTNDRVWNSLQKLCLRDPDTFAAYFGNAALAAASTAWLGPAYQMTAQVNLVYPGGAAQKAHRDYHLGFQTADIAALFPAHVHDLSPVLTLQGAVAHCDMPIESGPTKLLPFSQAYRPGYVAWRLPAFRAYFEAHFIQLPLAKGDALFFNPALFHAAGPNTSRGIDRMANLLQVSSAMGRALENVDRKSMCKALFPVLRGVDATTRRHAIAACAEGYSFPTNLDSDPPIGGLAPETQAALFHRALDESMSQAEFDKALDAQAARKRS